MSLPSWSVLSFRCLPTVQCVRNNLSSHWQDARAPLLVPKTQSLRNLKIRRFCSDPFSSLAQTFAVNWSRGSGIQTELCGLELDYHGKMFPSLLLCVSCFISLYIFFAPTVWPVILHKGCPLERVIRGNLKSQVRIPVQQRKWKSLTSTILVCSTKKRPVMFCRLC